MSIFRSLACLIVAMAALSSTGCWVATRTGPNIGPFGSMLGFPVPVSPYFQKIHEDRFNWHERYARVPILGAITEGGPAVALDPPSPDEVMRTLERARPVQGGLPLLSEIQRNNVRMVVEPIADYVDPPRFYPLIGPAQHHHAHYKCTIYFTEVTRVGWPLPHTLTDEDSVEVLYIDHNHLHLLNNVDAGVASNY